MMLPLVDSNNLGILKDYLGNVYWPLLVLILFKKWLPAKVIKLKMRQAEYLNIHQVVGFEVKWYYTSRKACLLWNSL